MATWDDWRGGAREPEMRRGQLRGTLLRLARLFELRCLDKRRYFSIIVQFSFHHVHFLIYKPPEPTCASDLCNCHVNCRPSRFLQLVDLKTRFLLIKTRNVQSAQHDDWKPSSALSEETKSLNLSFTVVGETFCKCIWQEGRCSDCSQGGADRYTPWSDVYIHSSRHGRH